VKSADTSGRHVSVDLIRAVGMSSISWLVRGTEQTQGGSAKDGRRLLIQRASFNSSVGYWGELGNTTLGGDPRGGTSKKATGLIRHLLCLWVNYFPVK
jgi:hypothetical protein